MLFGISPSTSRTPKFWRTYLIKYGDFAAIVEPCIVLFISKKSVFLKIIRVSKSTISPPSYILIQLSIRMTCSKGFKALLLTIS